MDIEATIRSYLPQIVHMSLATCHDNKPWVCEVHFSYDDDLNLYFSSTPDRRHCQEIATNPNVAGNMVTQHHLNQKVRGVYFEGTAKKLTNVTPDSTAFKVASKRFNLGPEILADTATDSGHGFYKISVSNFYVFDNYAGPSTKYHLPWAKKDASK